MIENNSHNKTNTIIQTQTIESLEQRYNIHDNGTVRRSGVSISFDDATVNDAQTTKSSLMYHQKDEDANEFQPFLQSSNTSDDEAVTQALLHKPDDDDAAVHVKEFSHTPCNNLLHFD